MPIEKAEEPRTPKASGPPDTRPTLEWPVDPENEESFGLQLAEKLEKHNYCIVKTFITQQEQEEVVAATQALAGWTIPKREFEPAYMGSGPATKYCMLPDDPIDEQPTSSLGRCDRMLTSVGRFLEPFSGMLGFPIWGRLNGMVRLPLASPGEERKLRPPHLGTRDYEDGQVFGHLGFLERRKILMMLFIENKGAELRLHPRKRNGFEDASTRITLESNIMVVLRHDTMGYSYYPSTKGQSLAIQAWLLTQPTVPVPREPGAVSLPEQIQGERVHVTSLAARYPGAVFDPEGFWNMSVGGCDGLVKIPTSRWDVELYYSPDKEDGSTYAIHGGFCSDSAVICFDNKLFGISEDEASNMSPNQRIILETGLDLLYRGGLLTEESSFSRGRSNDVECGVFLGDSGSEWHCFFGHSPDPNRILGLSNCVTGSRLSHLLGLRGPVSSTDTACSSSLVAINLAHTALRPPAPDQMRANVVSHVKTVVALGVNLILGPRYYILYSGPRMLSPRGRCFTFDSSADGYARGEGCGGVLMRSSKSDEDAQQMLACLIGSSVNQDGRSASMTAPNGPSQQACIKASMAESGLNASEITIAECHGTGTALGDPIEVSALRMVMQDRDLPILNMSAKSNIGHLEAAAGLAGFLKCVEAVMSSAGPPNAHFRLLNPHMDTNGYPVYFENEITDYGSKTGISGVSSFGFGGTNARADIWGRCQRGANATTELNSGEWLERRHIFFQRVYHYGTPGPHHSDQVCIIGSWDAYSGVQEMMRLQLGEYVATVVIGETRCEQFRLLLNFDSNQAFHPDKGLAGAEVPAQGPDAEGQRKNWLIDGRSDLMPAGAVYRVRFQWGFSWESGEYKQVTWEPDPRAAKPAPSLAFKHVYSLVGTWTAWKFLEMIPSRNEDGLWTTSVRIGLSGEEEFQITRDNDWCQVLHPAEALRLVPESKATSIPIWGPDDAGHGKNWYLRAPVGELVTIQLRVRNGEIKVMTACEAWSQRVREFRSDMEDAVLLGLDDDYD